MLQVQAWTSATATEMQCRIEGFTEAAAVYVSAEEVKAATAVVPAAGAAAAATADVPAAAAAPPPAAAPDDWEAEEVTAAVKHNSCKGPADRWLRLSGKAAKVIQFALNGGGDEGNARRRARKKEARARKRITRACRQMLKD